VINDGEIIDRVYEQTVEQAARVLFNELMIEDHSGTVRHANAERRFRYGLKLAAAARDRAKFLIQGNEQ